MSPIPFARSWMRFGLAGCGFAAWLALCGCEGSATQTTTGKGIQGMLVDTRGNPVGGAVVKAWPAGYGPIRSAQDSALAVSARTDARGHYAISDLEVGVYNLFGSDPANHATVLIPRVKYLEQAADLGTDTLKAPGVIVGQVRVDGGSPPPAFCYLEGSNYAVISDASGRFVLPDLAEGAYRLNYFANGYAGAIDSVTVRSGDTTVLAPKTLALDLALQPPAPGGVLATYDSVYGVVHLSWNPVHVGDFKEYWIEYEDDPAITLSYLPAQRAAWGVAGTAYDQGMMDYFGIYGTHRDPFTRTYWVRSKDTEGNLSPKGQGVSVRITDPLIFKTVFTLHAVPDSVAPGQCLDTLPLALDVVSSPDSLVRIQWRAQGFYRNSESRTGKNWSTLRNSIGVSIGAPHRDTLRLTHATLDGMGAVGQQVAFDSVVVSAALENQGGLIHSVTVPVRVDSLGCFRPSPAREQSNGKP